MATLEDNRPLIADLLDGLGLAAGAASLRHAAAIRDALPVDSYAGRGIVQA